MDLAAKALRGDVDAAGLIVVIVGVLLGQGAGAVLVLGLLRLIGRKFAQRFGGLDARDAKLNKVLQSPGGVGRRALTIALAAGDLLGLGRLKQGRVDGRTKGAHVLFIGRIGSPGQTSRKYR